jgi:hypothetical protein
MAKKNRTYQLTALYRQFIGIISAMGVAKNHDPR